MSFEFQKEFMVKSHFNLQEYFKILTQQSKCHLLHNNKYFRQVK